ncbi:endolysin [Microbacterium phage TinyMiny]|nr:endolysin [Microbacterium phage TinyMiny]
MMGYNYPGTYTDLGGGRGWLDAAAAASIKRIDAAIGHRLQITEAGRSFFKQEQHWLNYLRNGAPIALNPNTPSEHQKGKAIDSDEAQNFVAFMEEHGWFRTVYRWVNGKWTLVERWHFEYFIDRDKHRFDTTPSKPPTVSEEDDMTLMIKAASNIYVFSHGQIKNGDNPQQIQDALDAGIKQIDLSGTVAQVNEKLASRMNFFGVPQVVVCTDGVPRSMLDGNGHVLNPETNRYEKNGMWSWDRLNTAFARLAAQKK